MQKILSNINPDTQSSQGSQAGGCQDTGYAYSGSGSSLPDRDLSSKLARMRLVTSDLVTFPD